MQGNKLAGAEQEGSGKSCPIPACNTFQAGNCYGIIDGRDDQKLKDRHDDGLRAGICAPGVGVSPVPELPVQPEIPDG